MVTAWGLCLLAAGACSAPRYEAAAVSGGGTEGTQPSLLDRLPAWSPPVTVPDDLAPALGALLNVSSVVLEFPASMDAQRRARWGPAVARLLSVEVVGPSTPRAPGTAVVRVARMDADDDARRVRTRGSCALLQQRLALHETLGLARHEATVERLDAAFRRRFQKALRGEARTWTDRATLEGEGLSSDAPDAMCRDAVTRLGARLRACVDDLGACEDAPRVVLDGAVVLAHSDPWGGLGRDRCAEVARAEVRMYERVLRTVVDASRAMLDATPALPDLDRIARGRRVQDAVADVCMPRRRVLRPTTLRRMTALLDSFAFVDRLFSTSRPAMRPSMDKVYVAGSGWLVARAFSEDPLVAAQLDALVAEFRDAAQSMGRCPDGAEDRWQLEVMSDGRPPVAVEIYAEQLGCPDTTMETTSNP